MLHNHSSDAVSPEQNSRKPSSSEVAALIGLNPVRQRKQLLSRGRESAIEIKQRLVHHQQLLNNLDVELDSNLIKVDQPRRPGAQHQCTAGGDQAP